MLLGRAWFSGGGSDNRETSARLQRGKYYSLSLDQCAICADDDISSIDSSLNNTGVRLSADTHQVDSGEPRYALTVPYRTSCGHIYCYYCITGKLIVAFNDGEEGWECLRCKCLVTTVEREHVSEDIRTPEWETDMDDLRG